MSTDTIVYPVLFITLGFIFWVLATEMRRRRRLKMLIDLRLRLLERLESAADIAALLQSEGGARLLQDPIEEPSGGGFRDQVIRTAQNGIVLLLIGAGLLVLAWLNAFEARSALIAFAVMAAFVGAGFALSAALAWRLGGRSGLLAHAPLQGDGAAGARDR
jgi:hypothetical protein